MNTNTMNVAIRRITPENAKAYLATSERNRRVNENRVKRYALDMKNGNWSPATLLIFDEDGHMVDAHHRMQAVIAAGVAVDMCVFTGLPKRFIPFIDTGRPRTAGDMLAFIEGLDGVGALQNKSTIVRLVLASGRGCAGAMISHDEIANFMLDNKSAVNEAYVFYNAIKPLGPTLAAGAAAYMIKSAFPMMSDKFDEFKTQIIGGEMLKAGMPTYALRNALFANSKTRSGGQRQKNDIYYILKAWRAFVRGEEIKILRRPKTYEASDFTAAV